MSSLGRRDFLGRHYRRDEGSVARFVEGAIDVSTFFPRLPLVVTRLHPADVEVDRLLVRDRRDGIEEGEAVVLCERADRLRQRVGGERSGRDDDIGPVFRRQARDFAALNGNVRMVFQRPGHRCGKSVTIHGKRAACRQAMRVGRTQDQGARAAHLFVQQADGIVLGVIRTERVGAHELRQPVCLVRIGSAHRPHLVQHHARAVFRRPPSRFAACQPAANDVDCVHGQPNKPDGPTTQSRPIVFSARLANSV